MKIRPKSARTERFDYDRRTSGLRYAYDEQPLSILGIMLIAAVPALTAAVWVGFVTGSFWLALISYAAIGVASGILVALWAISRPVAGREPTAGVPRLHSYLASTDAHGADEAESRDNLPLENWWRRMPRDGQVEQSSRVICVADGTADSFQHLAMILTDHGLEVDVCNDLDTVLASVAEAPEVWSSLIVDLDLAEQRSSLGEVIDTLSSFRRVISNVPVVLISVNFSRDDLEHHRQMVADVSLRAPLMARRLADGLTEAKVNNRLWEKRQRAFLRPVSQPENRTGESQ